MNKIIFLLLGLVIAICVFISIPIYVSNDCNILPHPISIKLGLPWKQIPCKYNGFIWGKSAIEYGSDLKCLIDQQGFCFLYGSCNPNACKPKIEYKTNDSAIQKLINNGCISYFDGCNSCSVNSSGHGECTIMWCSTILEPKCNKYK